jgi:hypothetical protein
MCQLAKAKRRPTGATHKKTNPVRQDVLAANLLNPGDKVFMDQYESSICGRLPNTYSHEKESSMYVGGTIFINVASHTIHVYHQVSLAAADTLLSKAQFEQDAASYGVSIKQYHVDNGIITSTAWKDNLHREQQQQ